jgi:hypothetical protein
LKFSHPAIRQRTPRRRFKDLEYEIGWPNGSWFDFVRKLHNFYTGYERMFHLVVAELNGAPVSSFD